MSTLAQFVDCLTETSVRLLKPGEHVPLDIGFSNPDPDWTWVQVEDGAITAALLACPCHGMVQLVRLVGRASTRLLRQCVRNCSDRGYAGFIIWLDPSIPACEKLLRILKLAKATVIESSHLCVGVSASELRKW